MYFCEYILVFVFKLVCLIEESSNFMQEETVKSKYFLYLALQLCVNKLSAKCFFFEALALNVCSIFFHVQGCLLNIRVLRYASFTEKRI